VNIGTQEYMAPEVRLFETERTGKKAKYTIKADMWALGGICVHLITGDAAFCRSIPCCFIPFPGCLGGGLVRQRPPFAAELLPTIYA
jgi:serine/threonine protein kinase